jgi:hypothetical protein
VTPADSIIATVGAPQGIVLGVDTRVNVGHDHAFAPRFGPCRVSLDTLLGLELGVRVRVMVRVRVRVRARARVIP